MNEEELPIEQNTLVEEKNFPASPKSEDIKIDEVSYPSVADEIGNIVVGDTSFNKIEIPEEPAFPTKPEEPFEEKVKVEGIESNLPPSVNEMGEIAFGDFTLEPQKTSEELLEDEKKFNEGLIQAQKEIFIIGKGGQKMTMFDWLNKTDKEYNAVQSVASALVSGTIDLGYGFFTIPARIQDYFGPVDTPTAAGKAAKLENWFKTTWAGELHTMTKEAAHSTAIGRLTEAITEIYGAARVGQQGLAGATKISALAEEIYAATKANRLIDTSKIVARASEKANILNNLTGWKKWTAIGIGGGAGIGYLIPSEDLGTLGEIFGGPTQLDRVTRPLAQDDAVRFFNNQLKFGAENSIFTGIVTGGFSIAKGLATQGKEWAFSNSLVERWVDKFASYLRPRGKKSAELFEEVERVAGKVESAETTTKDLMNSIDNNIIEIRNGTEELAQSTKFEEFLNRTNKMLHSGDNVVQKGKIVFKGYNNKELMGYEKFLKDLGVKDEQITKLKTNFFQIRDSYNNFMNEVLQGKNLNVAPKEFSKLMMDRVRNVLTPEYRMFTEKSIIPYFNYKPTLSSINEIKDILVRNITKQGAKVLPGDSDILINNILKGARINSETKSPSFKFPQTDALGKKRQVLIDLSNNYVDGKFTPTEIIKTKKEFEAFQKFFGARQDPRISILNVMGDLSEFAAKDKFANNIKNISQNLSKNKQRSIVYNSEMEAQRAFNPPGTPKNFVKEIVPLDIESNIGKLYTNPLNGTFTSKEYADALKFTERLPLEWLNDQAWYRWSLIIPKAAVSTAKTVLSVFAHIKNPLQNIAYFVGTGNIFKDPRFTLRSLKQSINAIQPQMLWKNLPKDQALYKFLQEERIVGMATDFNDVKKLLQTAEIGGQRIIDRLLGPVGKFITKSFRNLQNMYLAEDDAFKIINFAAEHDNLRIAYKEAAKKGFKMPDDLTILKEAASIVRDALPNYGRVGEGIKALRYSPLGNFPSWTAELFRNSVYIVERSIKEIKDPIKSGIGMRRLTGFGLATGVIIPKYVDWSRGAYDFTREQLSAMRDFLFDYEKNAEIAPSRDEDGNMLYQNLSSYPFTTITDIIQPVLVGVDNVKYNNLEDPLVKTMMIGLGRGFVDAAQPFLEKSIWYQFLDSVFGRDGLTDTGFRIWNKEAPLSEKWSQAINYGFKTIGLGSTGQMERLYLATTDKPGEKGEKYALSNELLGIVGFRKIKLDVPERLEGKLAQYSEKLNNDMKLFTKSPILKGGVTSSDDVVERFIIANEQKYKTDSEMQQTLNKAKTLEVPNEELFNKFKEAGQLSSYRSLENDSFKSFSISPKVKGKFGQQYEKLQDKGFNIEYSEPLDADTIDKINDIKQLLDGIPLNKNFREFINPKDWRSEGQGTGNKIAVAPLPPQPQPNSQILKPAQSSQAIMPQTGLTNTELALLSDEEKAMRLSQRGASPQQLS